MFSHVFTPPTPSWISNSYTMCCPPVRGDNPQALASGLSYLQEDKHGITILYHLHMFVDLAHHEIFRAKNGKGGITVDAGFKISYNHATRDIFIRDASVNSYFYPFLNAPKLTLRYRMVN